MSRKPNRRQQRHLEELEELQAIAQDTEAPAVEDSAAPATGFAAVRAC